jgi:hypothetical protein
VIPPPDSFFLTNPLPWRHTKALCPPKHHTDSLTHTHTHTHTITDLTDFIYKHPGGPTVLLNTQGRDCTALFEAFHPFTDRPAKLLGKMKEVSQNITDTYTYT